MEPGQERRPDPAGASGSQPSRTLSTYTVSLTVPSGTSALAVAEALIDSINHQAGAAGFIASFASNASDTVQMYRTGFTYISSDDNGIPGITLTSSASLVPSPTGEGSIDPCSRKRRPPCPMVTYARSRTGSFLRALPRASWSETADLEVDMDQAGVARLDLYDLLGRRVRTLFEGELPAGLSRFPWDGHDGNGSVARRGVYLARLTTPGGRYSTAILPGP